MTTMEYSMNLAYIVSYIFSDRVKEHKARTQWLIQEGAILEKAMPEVRVMELSDLETYLLQKR